MAVPTPETMVDLFWRSVGSIAYYILLCACLLYLLWWAVVEIRDLIRSHKIRKYLEQDEPVEWILDYPGYAMDEFSSISDDLR